MVAIHDTITFMYCTGLSMAAPDIPDGLRAVEEELDEGQPATALSILDHYFAHPTTPWLRDMKLLQFAWQYIMPKELG